jgi:hypothetical protein
MGVSTTTLCSLLYAHNVANLANVTKIQVRVSISVFPPAPETVKSENSKPPTNIN